MNPAWTTPERVAAKLRSRWDDGSLLRAYAEEVAFDAVDIPVHGPTAVQIADDLESARDWVRRLDAGRRDDTRYSLSWKSVGGRQAGRNRIPARAIVSSFDQAWRLLEVSAEVRRFDAILTQLARHPAVRSWVIAHPHGALALFDDWPTLLAAYDWLDGHRGSGNYLREISAPGVDTKFAERHRGVLAGMLGVSAGGVGFLTGLGLRRKPEMVRLRVGSALGLPVGITELALRTDEIVELDVRPRAAIVVENEISYLSVGVPADAVAIWGKGFDVDRVGRLPWLAGAHVVYWGDLDTHGFAILDRLRAWIPQTRSILMDRRTLLAHRDRWGIEDAPAASRLHLLPAEQKLYGDLVSDSFGERVRLEQERIDWTWVLAEFDLGPPDL